MNSTATVADTIKDGWNTIKESIFTVDLGNEKMTATFSDVDNDRVILREFIPVGLAFLMRDDKGNNDCDDKGNNDCEIVKSFLLTTLKFAQNGIFAPSITVNEPTQSLEPKLESDGPSDTGLWWIILVHSYMNKTLDHELLRSADVQDGIKKVLKNCMYGGFKTVPTLLCDDGCSMIDCKMGIHGYPIEIQALFFFAMKCAKRLLIRTKKEDDVIFQEDLSKRITDLKRYIRTKYWRDGRTDNHDVPEWVSFGDGGYFIGNVTRTDTDFRWFVVGNCIAILSNLATPHQAEKIMSFVRKNWDKLVGEAPVRLVYPAVAQVGNEMWYCFNGGSWPGLVWLFTAACIKANEPQLASQAIWVLDNCLYGDRWPYYYNGELKPKPVDEYENENTYRTFTCAGYVVSKMLLEDYDLLNIVEVGQVRYLSDEPAEHFLISKCLMPKVCASGKPRGLKS